MGCVSSQPVDIYYIYGIDRPKPLVKEPSPPEYKHSLQYINDEKEINPDLPKDKKEKKEDDESKKKKSKENDDDKGEKGDKEEGKKKPAAKKSAGGSKGGSSKPKGDKEEKEESFVPEKKKKPLFDDNSQTPGNKPLEASAPPISIANGGTHAKHKGSQPHKSLHGGHHGHGRHNPHQHKGTNDEFISPSTNAPNTHSHKKGKQESVYPAIHERFEGVDTPDQGFGTRGIEGQAAFRSRPKVKKTKHKRFNGDVNEAPHVYLVNHDLHEENSNSAIEGIPPPVYSMKSKHKENPDHESFVTGRNAHFPHTDKNHRTFEMDSYNTPEAINNSGDHEATGALLLGVMTHAMNRRHRYYSSEEDEEYHGKFSDDDSEDTSTTSTSSVEEAEEEELDLSGSGNESDDENSVKENIVNLNPVRQFHHSDNDLKSDSDENNTYENRTTLLIGETINRKYSEDASDHESNSDAALEIQDLDDDKAINNVEFEMEENPDDDESNREEDEHVNQVEEGDNESIEENGPDEIDNVNQVEGDNESVEENGPDEIDNVNQVEGDNESVEENDQDEIDNKAELSEDECPECHYQEIKDEENEFSDTNERPEDNSYYSVENQQANYNRHDYI